MQTIGTSPAVSAARVFLLTDVVGLAEQRAPLGVADDHVRARRPRAPSPALTSPVNAPSRSQCMFCAPTPIALPFSRFRRRRERRERRRDHDVDAAARP